MCACTALFISPCCDEILLVCQEAELWKSAFPGLCLLRGAEPALSGQQGVRSDGNVNSGGGGREGTFEESAQDTAHLLGKPHSLAASLLPWLSD